MLSNFRRVSTPACCLKKRLLIEITSAPPLTYRNNQNSNKFETLYILHWLSIEHQLRARRALMLFNDVSLRTRRALSLYKVYGVGALLVLNWTSLNRVNALLAPSYEIFAFSFNIFFPPTILCSLFFFFYIIRIPYRLPVHTESDDYFINCGSLYIFEFDQRWCFKGSKRSKFPWNSLHKLLLPLKMSERLPETKWK